MSMSGLSCVYFLLWLLLISNETKSTDRTAVKRGVYHCHHHNHFLGGVGWGFVALGSSPLLSCLSVCLTYASLASSSYTCSLQLFFLVCVLKGMGLAFTFFSGF